MAGGGSRAALDAGDLTRVGEEQNGRCCCRHPQHPGANGPERAQTRARDQPREVHQARGGGVGGQRPGRVAPRRQASRERQPGQAGPPQGDGCERELGVVAEREEQSNGSQQRQYRHQGASGRRRAATMASAALFAVLAPQREQESQRADSGSDDGQDDEGGHALPPGRSDRRATLPESPRRVEPHPPCAASAPAPRRRHTGRARARRPTRRRGARRACRPWRRASPERGGRPRAGGPR